MCTFGSSAMLDVWDWTFFSTNAFEKPGGTSGLAAGAGRIGGVLVVSS
jgi:hypothetical protein